MNHRSTVRYAGLGIRLLAMLVDGLLLAFVFAVLRFLPVLWNPALYLEPEYPTA